MSNEKNTGGPAFPRQHTVADANDNAFKMGHEGMSLRDYFAAKAMQGDLASAELDVRDKDSAAVWYYAMADAMLKAREQ
jgi:hypothetical protein